MKWVIGKIVEGRIIQ